MLDFLIAPLLVFSVLTGWILVQQVYRRFARNNPQLGPFRPDGPSCGSCSCGGSKTCSVKKP